VFIETVDPSFRIPKLVVNVVCNTYSGEKFSGEIFLDGTGSCTPRKILDFLNSESLFLPVKTSSQETPRLISKNALILVETSRFIPDVRKETSAFLTQRRNALFQVQSLGSLHAEILIDTPKDQARVLDVLNLAQRFLPVLYEEKYCLLNSNRILEVLET